MSSKVFKRVAGVNPGRSVFDLSYESKLTADMGYLIPVQCDEVVPGDHFRIGHEVMVRVMPLIAPIMHAINVYAHIFFVPYRLLWEDWEEFITGGVDGESAPVLPRWEPTNTAVGSLWDHLGFPTMTPGKIPEGALPISFPLRAYKFIYNEYYRDENLEEEYDITDDAEEIGCLIRNWEKDYFTSALPWQQRGTAPALPISGTSKAEWPDSQFDTQNPFTSADFGFADAYSYFKALTKEGFANTNAKGFFAANTVDLSDAVTFDVADLRLAFQIQKWMERNARAGVRYTEFLKAHFGVNPRDDRLQRPEYIGGSKTPVIVSEVLQTSSTDSTTPQGNMSGHGISVDRQFAGSYAVKEFGLIMTVMSIMPKPAYQNGIDRQWLRRTKYDFYFPEFANLSEQAIENAEVAVTGEESENIGIFGYQGRYDEMRIKKNQIHGKLRTTMSYWHLGRIFTDSAPQLLNDAFVACQPDKRIFAAPSEPGFVVSFGNIIKAVRPMPIQSNPGLIDHDA